MITSLHGISIVHSNLITDVRIAKEAGFDGLDIDVQKLQRYLAAGMDPQELIQVFRKQGIQPTVINCLKPIEQVDPDERERMLLEAESLCELAQVIGCPTMQIVALGGLAGLSWSETRELLACNVAAIGEIGERYGVRFQFEPVSWTAIDSLSRSLELIEEAGKDNVGLVIDFWHLWVTGNTKPEEVACLDPKQIYAVHICDGTRSEPGSTQPEEVLRGYLPGDGMIPIEEWVSAVKSTGFDGVWSNEVISPRMWEQDIIEVPKACRERMRAYIG